MRVINTASMDIDLEKEVYKDRSQLVRKYHSSPSQIFKGFRHYIYRS